MAAGDGVALLRAEAGRSPDDRVLTELIGELTTRSDRFSALWATHDVRWHTTGTKHFHHRVVGDLTLAFESLDLPGDDGQALITYTAEPGSPSQQALRFLASWAASSENTAATPRERGPPGLSRSDRQAGHAGARRRRPPSGRRPRPPAVLAAVGAGSELRAAIPTGRRRGRAAPRGPGTRAVPAWRGSPRWPARCRGSRSAAARIRSDGNRRVRSTSPPSHRRTASPSISTWSTTHGRMLSSHHASNGSPTSAGRARLSSRASNWSDLEERRGHAPAEDRRGRGDRVTDADQPGDARPAVAPLLPAVVVVQRTAGQDVGHRRGPVRVRPRGQAGDGPAGGLEGGLVPQVLQGRIGGRPDQDHGEVPLLVQEHQHLVAVEVALPGERVGHRPGLRAVAQAVLAVHVGHAARAARPSRAPAARRRSGRTARTRPPPGPPRTGEPSTTMPRTRPSDETTPSTCPCRIDRPGTVSAVVRRARSKVSRRDRCPAGTDADARQVERDGLGAEGEPRVERRRPLPRRAPSPPAAGSRGRGGTASRRAAASGRAADGCPGPPRRRRGRGRPARCRGTGRPGRLR